MGMKGLSATSGAALEDSSRGSFHGTRGPGREGRSVSKEEAGEGLDNLSPLSSYSAAQRPSVQVRIFGLLSKFCQQRFCPYALAWA